MLNIFPIQFLAPLAYLLLRLCVGYICIILGIRHYKNRNLSIISSSPFPRAQPTLFIGVGIIEVAMGILFIFGAYTQIAALAAICLTLIHMIQPNILRYPECPSRLFFLLLFTCALSLFITGAGPFAFDLPI